MDVGWAVGVAGRGDLAELEVVRRGHRQMWRSCPPSVGGHHEQLACRGRHQTRPSRQSDQHSDDEPQQRHWRHGRQCSDDGRTLTGPCPGGPGGKPPPERTSSDPIGSLYRWSSGRTREPTDSRAGPNRTFTDLFRTLTGAVEEVVKGKRDVVQLALLALLSEGHILLEDAPGVGKTTIGKALAAAIDVPFGRVQFTPDLLPSDVVGVSIWNRGTDSFEFRAGPIFNGIVLADEVNRASPKTQSALLEAMAERQVTVDGVTRSLGSPFMVIATQNPLEHAGTYPLPESQLDRFLVKVTVGYPSRDAEIEILEGHGDHDLLDDMRPVADTRRIQAMARAVRSVHVGPAIQGYLIDIAEATRRHPALALGASPRASARAAAHLPGPCRSRRPQLRDARRRQGTGSPRAAPPSGRLPERPDARAPPHSRSIDEILQVVPAGAA